MAVLASLGIAVIVSGAPFWTGTVRFPLPSRLPCAIVSRDVKDLFPMRQLCKLG